MNIVDITSLPKIRFAHSFEADSYNTCLSSAPNCVEVMYIMEGTLYYQIEQTQFCAEKGDVICLLHNHPITTSSPAFHRHHTVCAFLDWHFCDDALSGLYLPTVTKAANVSSEIYRIIDELIHNQALYKSSLARGAALFLQLLGEIDNCNHMPNSHHLSGEQLYVLRAKKYIEEHICIPITQNAVAQHLGISSGYLCSIFKRIEGTTIIRYINQIKLEHIKTLIDRENVRLYDAAARYGYSDPNYVSRLFKQVYGYNITEKLYAFEQSE